ncbi:ubiquitin carboxyl-terminal hydrolase [Stachybotrys elegans]|uniref:Ubiquitin carboxyl-terminal hydrolase n=1 Tax=Stachybotrys elegans TaxID=80388 RepID=A0A8K0SR27_9HYPO|nr:ubiquitin carboxyl-terminal hydrolase [Stachybotrys elegans]
MTFYRKHYIPLESSPELFTELIHKIGVSPGLEFHDVLSLEDDDLMAMLPRPVYALILVFPTSEEYESHVVAADKDASEYDRGGGHESAVWYKQTINNACGLYAILHAISNGKARDYIAPTSVMSDLLARCAPLNPSDRALIIEDSQELETSYKETALQGDSDVPEDPEAEVDFHYICFVKSHVDGHLYQLDGDRKGPIDCGKIEEADDLLSPQALDVVRGFIASIGRSVGFSLLALCPSSG